ncbi:hypothetical protein CC2G_010055 [Coprinopsis cinerea AmutBmut pab1-1]|nr:hypothetical protein CC2G_010055 [Coprinopsis cinerea AmutBmut pab1-1]
MASSSSQIVHPCQHFIPSIYADKLRVPHDDPVVSRMSGNACDGVKWYCWAVFRHFVGESGTWFASSIGTSVRLVEVNLWSTDGNGKPTKAESVFEVVVTKEMCNPFGILHGACAGYLLDYCSVTPLVALGYHNGEDGTGLSQSMNIIYHGAAPIGSKLRIVSASIVLRGRTRICKAEIWSGSKLRMTGIHSLINSPGMTRLQKRDDDNTQSSSSLTKRGYSPSSPTRLDVGCSLLLNEIMVQAKL